MKKFILPALVMIMGSGAALATQSFRSADKAIVEGYRIDDSDPQNVTCVNMEISCSDVPTAFVCEDAAGNPLYQLQGTSCPTQLFKP